MQTHVHKTTSRPEETTEDPVPSEHPTVEDVDSWLDEIDEVLEDNALEFTRSYVQKGGQ